MKIDNLPNHNFKREGDYVLLVDHGCDGMSLIARGHTLDEVWAKQDLAYGSPVTLLKLVELEIREDRDENLEGD